MNLIDQLEQLERDSKKRGIPIIGAEKGRWLLSFVEQHKPQKILEIGTAVGYSGIILGSAGGNVITIDKNAKELKEAELNFTHCEIKHTCLLGEGVAVVSSLTKIKTSFFDLIFIDFAKKQYRAILDDCLTLIKEGGYIIADNISKDDCRDFKEEICHHPQLKTEIINIGDGLSCSKVIKNDA